MKKILVKILVGILVASSVYNINSVNAKSSKTQGMETNNANTLSTRALGDKEDPYNSWDFPDSISVGDYISDEIILDDVYDFEVLRTDNASVDVQKDGTMVVSPIDTSVNKEFQIWLAPSGSVIDVNKEFAMLINTDRAIYKRGFYADSKERAPLSPGMNTESAFGYAFYDAMRTGVDSFDAPSVRPGTLYGGKKEYNYGRYSYKTPQVISPDVGLAVPRGLNDFDPPVDRYTPITFNYNYNDSVSVDFSSSLAKRAVLSTCNIKTLLPNSHCWNDGDFLTTQFVSSAVSSSDSNGNAIHALENSNYFGFHLSEFTSYDASSTQANKSFFGPFKLEDIKFHYYSKEHSEIRTKEHLLGFVAQKDANLEEVRNEKLAQITSNAAPTYYFFDHIDGENTDNLRLETKEVLTSSNIVNPSEINFEVPADYTIKYEKSNSNSDSLVDAAVSIPVRVIEPAVFENKIVEVSGENYALPPTNEQELFDLMFVSGQNTNRSALTLSDVTITNVDNFSFDKPKDGLYEFDFKVSYTSGQVLDYRVNLLVKDDNTGSGEIEQIEYVIVANDFVIDKRSSSNYDATKYDSSEDIVLNAKAKVVNALTIVEDEDKLVVASPTSFVNSSAGAYSTGYNIDGTNILTKANVFIIDDNSVVGTDGVVVNGDNFVITTEVAKTLNESDLIDKSKASAYNIKELKILDLNVSRSDLESINSGVEGVYTVKLTVDSSTTSKTVYVTVYDGNGALTGDGNYLLQADSFIVDLTNGDVLPSSLEQFVEYANTKITDTRTGLEISDIPGLSVTPTTMENYKDGLYKVTFTLENNSADAVLTVNALVKDRNTGIGITDDEEIAITADDILIDRRSNTNYDPSLYDSAEDIIILANAKIIKVSTITEDNNRELVVEPASFVDHKPGIYHALFTTYGDKQENFVRSYATSVTGWSNVFIIDDNSVIGDDNVVINANNFIVNKEQAINLNKDEILDNSYANSFNLDTGDVYDVLVHDSDIIAINTGVAGVYPVRLRVEESQTSKMIYVTSTGDNGVVTGDGEYLIIANNFAVDLDAGNELPTTVEQFVDYADLEIFKTTNGESVNDYTNLTVSPSSFEGMTSGFVNVTFTYTSNNEITEKTVIARINEKMTYSKSTYSLEGQTAIIHKDDLLDANLIEEFDLQLKVETQGDVRKEYDLNETIFTVDNMKIEYLSPELYFVDINLDDLHVKLPLVVINDYTKIDNGKVLFVDNINLKYTDEKVKSLIFDDIINDINAKAYNIESGEVLELTTQTPEVIENITSGEAGIYEISVKANPEIYITIEVVETGEIENPVTPEPPMVEEVVQVPKQDELVETGSTNYFVFIILMLIVLLVTRKFSKH